MCIGIPMQVTATYGYTATCGQAGYPPESVDTSLVGRVAVGDWLLVHLGTAREVLSAERAIVITQAVQALAAVQRGDDFEHLFADLINRPPELPAHLRSKHHAPD